MTLRPLGILLSLISLGSCTIVFAGDPSFPSATEPIDSLASWLDSRFESRWTVNHVEAPAIVDDATFLRRIYLDLCGTIPSVSQIWDFLEDQSADKHANLVDRLLTDSRCPKHLARVWRRMMVPGNGAEAALATQLFEPWLVSQFSANVRYDQMARQVIVSSRQNEMMQQNENANGARVIPTPSAAAFSQAVGQTPDAIAGACTRFFLGISLNCAKCHDHPFAKWKQQDFWGMAAFFANPQDGRIGRIRSENGKEFVAVFLGGEMPSIPSDRPPTEVLVDWITSSSNLNFGATAVNRVWQHLYGRGGVSEIDDLDRVSAEERAFFLDELGHQFAGRNYDLRWLLSNLCKSRTYRRETPGKSPSGQTDLLTQRPLKTLLPEQVFDSLEQALNLPIGRCDDSPRANGTRVQMVAKLNEAATGHPDQFRSGIPQILMLMHGSMISNATDIETSRTLRAVVEAPFFDRTEKIEALYLATLTRKPREEELKSMLAFIAEQPDSQQQRQAYSEIFWALLNSSEFVLSR